LTKASPDDVWLGQGRRRRAMDVILDLVKENSGSPYGKLVSIISFSTGLSRRKIADDYLIVLRDVGLLEITGGIVTSVKPQSSE